MISRTEKKVVTVIVVFAIVVLSAYIAVFHHQPISRDPALWGQLGDYLGGTLNPFFGLLTTIFAFFAFKSTKESLDLAKKTAQYEELRIALESFYKIYDNRLSNLKINKDSRMPEILTKILLDQEQIIQDELLQGKDALRQMRLYFGYLLVDLDFSHLASVNSTFIKSELDFYVQEIHSLIKMIEPLRSTLIGKEIKNKFLFIVSEYLNSEIIEIARILSDDRVISHYEGTSLGENLKSINEVDLILKSLNP
jgi:hypothetical protein